MAAINGNLGVDLRFDPSPEFSFSLKSSEYVSPEAGIQNSDWDWMKFYPFSFSCRNDYDSFKEQFKSYLEKASTIVETGEISARIQVVPKALLGKAEVSWLRLINGTHRLILNQISTLNSIVKLNITGAGLIAGSAIGLYYTKPEYKKTRMGLQGLLIAGLASVVFATFKANSSINMLRELYLQKN